jgi:hypothetical protein
VPINGDLPDRPTGIDLMIDIIDIIPGRPNGYIRGSFFLTAICQRRSRRNCWRMIDRPLDDTSKAAGE